MQFKRINRCYPKLFVASEWNQGHMHIPPQVPQAQKQKARLGVVDVGSPREAAFVSHIRETPGGTPQEQGGLAKAFRTQAAHILPSW
eukprot:5407513-Amphidinium_carterae.1